LFLLQVKVETPTPTYTSPAWEFAADTPSAEIAAPAKQGFPHHWQFSKAHTGPRIA
jgi:hypothetical protein